MHRFKERHFRSHTQKQNDPFGFKNRTKTIEKELKKMPSPATNACQKNHNMNENKEYLEQKLNQDAQVLSMELAQDVLWYAQKKGKKGDMTGKYQEMFQELKKVIQQECHPEEKKENETDQCDINTPGHRVFGQEENTLCSYFNSEHGKFRNFSRIQIKQWPKKNDREDRTYHFRKKSPLSSCSAIKEKAIEEDIEIHLSSRLEKQLTKEMREQEHPDVIAQAKRKMRERLTICKDFGGLSDVGKIYQKESITMEKEIFSSLISLSRENNVITKRYSTTKDNTASALFPTTRPQRTIPLLISKNKNLCPESWTHEHRIITALGVLIGVIPIFIFFFLKSWIFKPNNKHSLCPVKKKKRKKREDAILRQERTYAYDTEIEMVEMHIPE